MRNNYNTEQKNMILDCLMKNSDKYISVNEISKYLSKNDAQVGTTTIYRYLNNLEKDGVLRTETVNNTKYYQYIVEECKNHYHLKCEKCGRIEHLECNEIVTLCSHVEKSHNFVISQKNAIYGMCGLCSTKNREEI